MPIKRSAAAHPKSREGVPERGDSFVDPSRPDEIERPDEREEVIDLLARDGDRQEAREAREEEGEQPVRGEDDEEGERPARREARPTRKEKYSRKVEARINREIALRRQRETELTEERVARQQLQERLEKVERAQTEIASSATIKALEAKVADIKGKLAKAIEDGETATQLDLQIQLGDTLADIKVQKAELARQQTEAQAARTTEQKTREASTARVGKDETAEWMKANRTWWNRREHAGAKAEAIEIDKDLLAEIEDGALDFKPYSTEHFEELARRLTEKFPDVEVVDAKGEPYEFGGEDEEEEEPVNDRNNRTPARPPMGSMGGRSGRRQPNPVELAQAGKIRLTEEDYAQMRRFQLDPNDPEQRKRFARERQRTILTDAQRGDAR